MPFSSVSWALSGGAVGAFFVLWRMFSFEERLRKLKYTLSGMDAWEQRLRRIEETSRTDTLTGVGSAIWLESERWHAALRSGKPLCVAWFDVDGLKAKNDTDGHLAGDRLIKSTAAALQLSVRRGLDEVFRVHTKGDEFLVLLHGPLDPNKVAHEFRRHLSEHGVSASGGLAYTTQLDWVARDPLRQQAWAGCQQAKVQGGDRILVVHADGNPVPTDQSTVPDAIEPETAAPHLIEQQAALTVRHELESQRQQAALSRVLT